MQRHNNRSRQLATICCAVAAVVVAHPAFGQLSRTWIGPSTGTWSVGANWSSGISPNNFDSVTFAPDGIAFHNVALDQNVSLSAINIIGTRTTISNLNSGTPSIISMEAGTLNGTGGPTPTLPTLNSITLSGNRVDVNLAGSGGLTITGDSGSFLDGTNTFKGGLTIDGGFLSARKDVALGTLGEPIRMNNASLVTFPTTINRPFQLGPGTSTLYGVGTITQDISGTGALRVDRNANWTVGSLTHSGGTFVNRSTLWVTGQTTNGGGQPISVRNGTFAFGGSGTLGTNYLPDATPILLNNGGVRLTMSATSGATAEAIGPVTLLGGRCVVQSRGSNEFGGALTVASLTRTNRATLEVNFKERFSGSFTPQYSSIALADNNVPTIGGGGTIGTSTNGSIVPFAYGWNYNPTYVGYQAGIGFYPLYDNEYVSSVSPGVSTNNVSISSATQTLNTPATINALRMTQFWFPNASTLSGASTLTITSGAILAADGVATLSVPINFATAEGMMNAAISSLTINGPISGTNGVTLGGTVSLQSTASTYTGQTTLNSAYVRYAGSVGVQGAPSALGQEASPLIVSGTSTLESTTPRAIVNRDIIVRGVADDETSASLELHGTFPGDEVSYNGNILLQGGSLRINMDGYAISPPPTLIVNFNGDITGNGALAVSTNGPFIARMNGQNTYTGNSYLSGGGTFEIATDRPFGSGTIVLGTNFWGGGNAPPTLVAMNGPLVIDNPLNFFFSNSGLIVAGAQPVTFTNDVLSGGSFTSQSSEPVTISGHILKGPLGKFGVGTLILPNDNQYEGATTIQGGTLRILTNNGLGLSAPAAADTTISGAAVLELAGGAGGITTAERISLTTGTSAPLGNLRSVSGANHINADVRVGSACSIGVDLASTLDISGDLIDASTGTIATGMLTKVGAGQLSVNPIHLPFVTLNAGTTSIHGGGGASKIGTLTFAGGPLTPTVTLDVNDTDAVLTSTSIADVQSLIRTARHGGAWDQAGVTSSAARSASPRNTTLGVLSGADYRSVYGPTATFDTFAVANTDVLVKYTYYGDTDFNGVIDFDDYARIDASFNNHLGGWFNGDFDLSGTIDFDDYSLIDLAFNTQSGTLGDTHARGLMNTVPEPAGGAMLSLCLLFGGCGCVRRNRGRLARLSA